MSDPSPTFKYTGDDVLDVMSHFAKNRNLSVEDLIIKHIGLYSYENKEPLKVLEFGAGKGEFIDRFVGKEGLETYVVELDDEYRKDLAIRHKVFREISDVPDTYLDGIYLIDVLEHLQEDIMFLKQFYQKLKPGGKLFIYVPARMELYSAFDKKIGHFRRYHKKELEKKGIEAGFLVETLRYHEILGYFAAYFNKFFSKANDGNLNASAVKIYDKLFVPTTNFFERWINPPIGKSLYALFIKKAKT